MVSTREEGEASIMVWAAILYTGPLNIVKIDGSLYSKYYSEVLGEALILKASEMYGNIWTFVQNITIVLSPEYTNLCSESQEIHVLPLKSHLI